MSKLRRYLSWFILEVYTVILIVAYNRPPNSSVINRTTSAATSEGKA